MKRKIKLTETLLKKYGITINLKDIPESQRYVKRISSPIHLNLEQVEDSSVSKEIRNLEQVEDSSVSKEIRNLEQDTHSQSVHARTTDNTLYPTIPAPGEQAPPNSGPRQDPDPNPGPDAVADNTHNIGNGYNQQATPQSPKPSDVPHDKELSNSCDGWISTIDIDADGEIVLPSAIKTDRYAKNPIVLYNHNLENLPVAKCTALKITDKGIMASTEFASHQEAQDVYHLVKQGVLNTFSIGFIPIKYVKKGTSEFNTIVKDLQMKHPDKFKDLSDLKQILVDAIMYEYSVVNVPANEDALILECKSMSQSSKDMILYGKTIEIEDEEITVKHLEVEEEIKIINDAEEITILGHDYSEKIKKMIKGVY